MILLLMYSYTMNGKDIQLLSWLRLTDVTMTFFIEFHRKLMVNRKQNIVTTKCI